MEESNTKKIFNIFDVTDERNQDLYFLLYFCIWNTYASQTPLSSVLRKFSFLFCILPMIFSVIKTKRLIVNKFIKWMILFLLYNIISLLWTKSLQDSYIYINIIIKILLISICISSRIKSIDDINKIIKLFVFSTFYMSICLLIMTPSSDWGTNQIGSVLGMWKNTVGTETSIGAVLAIYLIITNKNSREKIFYIIESVLLTFITFFSGSRKALILIPAACLIVFLISADRSLDYKKIMKRLYVGIALIFLIVVSIILIINNKVLYDLVGFRLYEAYLAIVDPTSQVADGSIIERRFYIEQAKQLFLDHPILGCGANGFLTYMGKIGYSHVAYSHNNFWELLSTLGIVGFSIYYFMQIYLLVFLYPKKYIEKETKNLTAFLWSLNLLIFIFGYWFVYSYDQFCNVILILGFSCTLLKKQNL